MLTVTVPATNTKLTTIARVKTELEVTTTDDDAFLTDTIREASDFIVKHTGRDFARVTLTETLAASGGPELLLERTPVQSISAVTLAGSTISSTTYEIEDSDAGLLWRETGWDSTMLKSHFIESFSLHKGKRDWSITYVAGYVTPGDTGTTIARDLPYDVERACIDMVKSFYLRRGDDTRVRHQSVDKTFEVLSTAYLSPSTISILKRWRRVDVGLGI